MKKTGKEYLRLWAYMDWTYNARITDMKKKHWPSHFGAYSHSTAKPSCSRYERNIR
jgi:hypothetical protein